MLYILLISKMHVAKHRTEITALEEVEETGLFHPRDGLLMDPTVPTQPPQIIQHSRGFGTLPRAARPQPVMPYSTQIPVFATPLGDEDDLDAMADIAIKTLNSDHHRAKVALSFFSPIKNSSFLPC